MSLTNHDNSFNWFKYIKDHVQIEKFMYEILQINIIKLHNNSTTTNTKKMVYNIKWYFMMNTNYITNKIKSDRWILLRTHEWTLFHARAAKNTSNYDPRSITVC